MILPYPVARAALWLTGRRRKFLSAKAMMEAIAQARLSDDANPPAAIKKRVKITERQIQGFRCMTLSPLGQATAKKVLYIHGGSYVSQILPAHWSFIVRLIELSGCTVEVPVYGLAPEHGYREAYSLLNQIWSELSAQAKTSDLALVGDSAGAGLALGFAQSLLHSKLSQPKEIALISPWLDLSLKNPEIPNVQPLDPWLSTPGLIEAGRHWADGDDTERFELSPIFGPLKGLGRITVFVGTREIMLPDCELLNTRAQAEGVSFELNLGQGMIHVWPLLPIAQAKGPIEKIANLIQGTEAISPR